LLNPENLETALRTVALFMSPQQRLDVATKLKGLCEDMIHRAEAELAEGGGCGGNGQSHVTTGGPRR
jgi:hypothetical protein